MHEAHATCVKIDGATFWQPVLSFVCTDSVSVKGYVRGGGGDREVKRELYTKLVHIKLQRVDSTLSEFEVRFTVGN